MKKSNYLKIAIMAMIVGITFSACKRVIKRKLFYKMNFRKKEFLIMRKVPAEKHLKTLSPSLLIKSFH